MDMNDVIFSLGGVERITAPLNIDASDSELMLHLKNNVFGNSVPTVSQVKAHIPVYQSAISDAQFISIKKSFTDAIQIYIDSVAQSKGYDNGVSCASYGTDTHPPFADDANTFISWRSSVWLYCYGELSKVQAGTRYLPTVEQIISELPVIVW